MTRIAGKKPVLGPEPQLERKKHVAGPGWIGESHGRWTNLRRGIVSQLEGTDMAINKRRRRPLVFQGRKFYWDANDEVTLRIASEDKRFVVSMPVVFLPFAPSDNWPKDRILIRVAGPEFPGLEGRKDVHVVCRTITPDEVLATPGFVARLLEWCFDPTKPIELLASRR